MEETNNIKHYLNYIQELLDRDAPKKAYYNEQYDLYQCQHCKESVNINDNFCSKCGQKLLWKF